MLKGKSILTIVIVMFLLSYQLVATSLCAERIEITSENIGATLHNIATAMAKVINTKSKDIQATVVATGGGAENVKLVSQGKTDFGLFSRISLSAAIAKKTMTEEDEKYIRSVLSYLYAGGVQFIVVDDNIKTIKDLRNKKISLGAPGSTAAIVSGIVLEKHGLISGKDYKAQYLGISAAIDAIKDGNIDCFVGIWEIPNPLVSELGNYKKIRLLPIDEKVGPDIIKALPGFVLTRWDNKKGYPKQVNEEPFLMLGFVSGLGTNKGAKDNVVYEMTKLIWENLAEFKSYAGPGGVTFELAKALEGSHFLYHPGALKYYKEKGLKIPKEVVPSN